MATGCGETSEATAARAHKLVAILYTVAASALLPALLVEFVMLRWHWISAGVHTERAAREVER